MLALRKRRSPRCSIGLFECGNSGNSGKVPGGPDRLSNFCHTKSALLAKMHEFSFGFMNVLYTLMTADNCYK